MKTLNQILQGINYIGIADNRLIQKISYDSRMIEDNTLFVAIKGSKYDGHEYIDNAVKLGANAVLIDRDIRINKYSVPLLKVQNTRKAISRIASNFFGDCSQNIHITAVTGTNGKTTVTYLINHILKFNNYSTSALGTLGLQREKNIIKTGFTTPEALELQNIFYTLYNDNVTHLNMEISSHALSLNRVDDVNVNIALFTNLTPEHLDFHGNIDDYFKAKLKLFQNLSSSDTAILNYDDPYSQDIKKGTEAKILTYGLDQKSDLFAEGINMSLVGTSFIVNYQNKKFNVRTPLIGEFNISNILGAILACNTIGIEMDMIINAVNNFDLVPGRLEVYETKKNGIIIIDYAHTPDAFEKIFSLVKEISPKRKIISLFGCGGDRDKSKRPIMAQISEKYSDYIIITDDNPRFENPKDIINQIVSGFKLKKHKIIHNREQAIKKAIKNLNNNDILMILGKGVEEYQIVKNTNYNYSDIQTVKDSL